MQTKEKRTEQVNDRTTGRPFSVHRTYVGEENTNALYLHCHPEAEFFYLEEGRLAFCVENQIFELQGGDAIFVPPNFAHNATKASDLPCRYHAVVFSVEWLTDAMGGSAAPYFEIFGKHGYECVRTYRSGAKEDAEILKRLAGLSEYAQKAVQSYELRLVGELLISIQEIYNEVSGKIRYRERTDGAREGVQRSIDYIKLHYDKGIALAELVECSGYSESHFCHRFKSLTGYTPFAYLNRIRVSKAAEELVLSDEKITEIAARCGFDNIGYFNRVFRKETGMTPKAYRVSGRQGRHSAHSAGAEKVFDAMEQKR